MTVKGHVALEVGTKSPGFELTTDDRARPDRLSQRQWSNTGGFQKPLQTCTACIVMVAQNGLHAASDYTAALLVAYTIKRCGQLPNASSHRFCCYWSFPLSVLRSAAVSSYPQAIRAAFGPLSSPRPDPNLPPIMSQMAKVS